MNLNLLHSSYTCLGCALADQCAAEQICEDVDMQEEVENDLAYYDAIIRENFEIYQRVAEEYSDGNLTPF